MARGTHSREGLNKIVQSFKEHKEQLEHKNCLLCVYVVNDNRHGEFHVGKKICGNADSFMHESQVNGKSDCLKFVRRTRNK